VGWSGESRQRDVWKKIKKEGKTRVKEEAEDTVLVMLKMENSWGLEGVDSGCCEGEVDQ
jgi:hypothetical protein